MNKNYYYIEYKLHNQEDWVRLPDKYDHYPGREFDEFRYKWYQQCRMIKVVEESVGHHIPEWERHRG